MSFFGDDTLPLFSKHSTITPWHQQFKGKKKESKWVNYLIFDLENIKFTLITQKF